ncbi:MAG: DUF1549 domain-containing protein [Planctomycetia bacterium]|nr:DUF1549 domain-containing protein [Planctomycetia bacterium]
MALVLAVAASAPAQFSPDKAQSLPGRIDELTAAHWQAQGIAPAALSDDTEFLRRLTLDLIGRIPSRSEAQSFVTDSSPDKRPKAVRRLMEGSEFPLHFAAVLEGIIQGRRSGERDFAAYLRRKVEENAPWDGIFRQVVVGPWDDEKGADGFIRRRLNSLDDLTNDAARAFFGVNVSCAKCHDHPLVEDWKQAHYYGMQSFFARTYDDKKRKVIGEKDSGEVQFVDTAGNRHTAEVMFLSGTIVDTDARKLDPRLVDRFNAAKKKDQYAPPPQSLREELVNVALAEKKFLSRAIVNRLWAYMLGRGLVYPVDQMHSANPPSLPGVLELLADALVAGQYDLRLVVEAIANSRVYQLSSRTSGGERPGEEHFAVAQVRPLSPEQYAVSILLATGDERFDQVDSAERQRKLREELEGQAGRLAGKLDPPADDFQSSVSEALFMSNNAEVQKLTESSGQNLVARLAGRAPGEPAALVEAAFWTVLGRAPEPDESEQLLRWLAERPDRTRACRDLVWSLFTSAEFRFNH